MSSINFKFNVLKRTGIGLGACLIILYVVLWLVLSNLSVSRHGSVNLNFGNIVVPSERNRDWADRSELLKGVTVSIAEQRSDLGFGNAGTDHLIAQLATGQNIKSVNRILQQAKPWGAVGTHGNYDFTLCELTVMLYAFGGKPEVLSPETVDHMIDVLMTEKGGSPVVWTPGILGLPLRDTENHILMTEGSRYLTNRWIAQHGNPDPIYDNVQNGLEGYVLGYLEGMEHAGLHEYNSRPYIGYTLRGLLNLESFASEPVRASARRILDRMNWDYALGSLSFRRFPPFRRQSGRAGETNLDGDYHTGVMKGWLSLGGVTDLDIRHGAQHAMWVGLTSYRLPDAVADWVMSKPVEYFVQIGHGGDGSPEIYSGGPGYLITAGGVANDFGRQGVARPTTLMLEDGAMDLKELLHVAGPGESYREWNNTGVHRRFAVSAGPVSVPDAWKPSHTYGKWSFYERAGQRVGVFSSDSLGIFCLLGAGELDTRAKALVAANSDEERLKSQFQWPGGSALEYNVFAGKEQWVITSVDEKPVDRDHGRWPLMKGNVPGYEEHTHTAADPLGQTSLRHPDLGTHFDRGWVIK